MGNLIKTTDALNKILAFLNGVTTGDDAGLQVIDGQFTVGQPGDGRESVFGEGDSYPVTIAFHCDISDTAGLVITNAVDITSILQSDSGSTVGLFGGVAAGKYILVGSLYPYGGVKMKIDTGGTIEPANVLAEFLMDNTPSWTYAPYMCSDADFPYTQKANILAAGAGSEQWRFGFDPSNLPTPWDMVTLNINGTDYEYRWARFRIVTPITLDPVIEQVKLHTNRYEINADGITEYYGRSRYARDMVLHWHLTEELSGFSPANENITFGLGLTIVYKSNRMEWNKIDGRGGYIIIPVGFDTSIPIFFELLWTPLGDITGDVYFMFETVQAEVGDTLDNTNIPSQDPEIVTLPANQSNILHRTVFTFLANELTPGEMVAFSIKRLGTDVLDTFGANLAIVNVRAIGYFWRP